MKSQIPAFAILIAALSISPPSEARASYLQDFAIEHSQLDVADGAASVPAANLELPRGPSPALQIFVGGGANDTPSDAALGADSADSADSAGGMAATPIPASLLWLVVSVLGALGLWRRPRAG